MGNRSISHLHKAALILKELHNPELHPDEMPKLLLFILQSHGLCPRHETPAPTIALEEEKIRQLQARHKTLFDHHLRGWFEIHSTLPPEKTMVDICVFLEQRIDPLEKLAFFDSLLSSQYIPLKVNFFSRYVDDPEGDHLILRANASPYIQMRQSVNLPIGPTTRGSLIMEFLQTMSDHPQHQAIVLGAFIEELLQRLKQQKEPVVPSKGNVIPLDLSAGNFDDMAKQMRSLLPKEVLDQLRHFFGQLPGDDEPDWRSDIYPKDGDPHFP